MADTVWITAGIRDLPIALAHELVHVLTDSGEHSDAPANLMRDDTAPGNTELTADQCRSIVAIGAANGLRYDRGMSRDSAAASAKALSKQSRSRYRARSRSGAPRIQLRSLRWTAQA